MYRPFLQYNYSKHPVKIIVVVYRDVDLVHKVPGISSRDTTSLNHVHNRSLMPRCNNNTFIVFPATYRIIIQCVVVP